jgi:uncharacterized protein YpuA (DUF1002 family)
MTNEEAKEIIEDLKYSLDISLIGVSEINEIDNAMDIAVKSLEAWNKVKEEMKQTRDMYSNCGEVGIACGLSRAMDIIDKYREEN